jgi:Zn-dependent M28 family amino/carboxypeptidase
MNGAMRTTVVAAVLATAGCASHPSGSRPAADRAVDRAIGGHIAFLADDLLEGRGAGTRGHEIASRYVSTQLGNLGLEPGLGTNGWFQVVPLLESQVIEESRQMSLRHAEGTEVLDCPADFLVGAPFLGTNVSVTAPLVFVGFGVRAPELGYDDLAGVDLRGKIAVVLSKAPSRFPATALAHHSHARQKAKALADAGAVGVISVPTPKDLVESPWARQVMQARFPAMRWLDADGQPADVVPQLQVTGSLSPAGAAKVFARGPKPLAEVLAAGERGELQSFPLNVEATLAVRGEQRRISSPNVIGVLRGSDPKLAGEAVVVTAHLDHQGIGTPVNGDAIYNGAYDNAVGIAMMLESARALATEGKRPKRTVVFSAVTAEEKGLRGSEYLAQHFPQGVGRPVANVNLDMVLVTQPTRKFTVLGIEHSTLRGPVEKAAGRAGLELVPDPRPERVTFIRSDQYSFIRQGVPAIFPKVADIPGTQAKPGEVTPEVFVKDYYHRPSDDLSLPRDGESSVRFVRFMVDVLRQVADAEEAPRWNKGDFFGEMFGK